MKAISLWQPWASLIAQQIKGPETRSWPISYRGLLGIASAKRQPTAEDMRVVVDNMDAWNAWWRAGYVGPSSRDVRPGPLGAMVAVVNVVACVATEDVRFVDEPLGYWKLFEPALGPMELVLSRLHEPFGDYSPGRFAWVYDSVQQLDPVPVKGKQGLFEWDDAAVAS